MSGRAIVRRLQCERGQAFVEFAIILPFVFMLIFAIAYVGIAFARYLRVTDAAHAAARAGAVARFETPAATPCGAASATVAAIGDVGSLEACDGSGGPGTQLKVTVKYHFDLALPLIGDLTPPIDMTSTATARIE